LQASLVQQRTDEGTNVIDVRLTNAGKAPVRVEKVHITWEGITGSETSGTGTDYDPGRIIDIKTTFGTTVCGAHASDGVRVEVTLSDAGIITLPVDRSGADLLRRLFDRDCALRAIAAVANIELSATFSRASRGSDRLLGSVDVTRTAESRNGDRRQLTVVEVAGRVDDNLQSAVVGAGQSGGTFRATTVLRLQVRPHGRVSQRSSAECNQQHCRRCQHKLETDHIRHRYHRLTVGATTSWPPRTSDISAIASPRQDDEIVGPKSRRR
jgi:hypothetical protein